MGLDDEAWPVVSAAALESGRALWFLATRGAAALAAIAAWHWIVD